MLDDDNMEQEEDLDENPSETPATNKSSNQDKQKGTISADLIRGHINTIILRTLSERDKYGYEIIDEIERKSHGQYELKQPTLYSALKRLENQGYIKAYWKTDEISAGGRRKYFTLTDSGKKITEKNRAEWEYSRTVIDNLISDQDFDFSKPAPNPVDFKILKQSTSRVPTVKLEESSNAKRNEDETVVAYSYSEANDTVINIDASHIQFSEQPQADNNEPKDSSPEAPLPEQEKPEINEAETKQSDGVYSEEIASQKQEFAEQYQPPQPEEKHDQIYGTGIKEQEAAYFRSDSIEETYGDLYNQPARHEEPQAAPVRQQPEKLPTDSDQYKKLHENYLKLIDDNYAGNGKRKTQQPEYGENLDTDKLIYINKPETERDYKNLINEMYSKTIKPQNTVPAYEPQPQPQFQPQPEQYNQPAPTPVVESEPVHTPVYVEQSEEARRAESDGLRIYTSDKQPKPNGKYTKNYNLGYTLFKSAAVTFAYMIIIFIITISCKSLLGISLVYPFVIFGLACCVFAVNAVIALSGFGRNSAKPVTHGYIGICTILTVIAILIVCVASILLNIDFSSGADICRKIIIPSVTLLAAPLFTVIFYMFSK